MPTEAEIAAAAAAEAAAAAAAAAKATADAKAATDAEAAAAAAKPVTMTQADLDAMIAARVTRAKASAQGDAATAAGFGSWAEMQADVKRQNSLISRADMQAAATAAKTAAEAAKSELQRAQDAAEASGRLAQANAARAQTAILQAAFYRAAVVANVPADRIEDARALADLSAITVADDGKITGMDEAVAALVAAKPWVVGKAVATVGGGANGGARGNGQQSVTLAPGVAEMGALLGVRDEAALAAAAAARPGTPEHAAYVLEVAQRGMKQATKE